MSITLLVVCGLAGGVLGIATATKMYRSDIQLFVSAQTGAANLQDIYQGGLFTQQRVQSYAEIVKNRPITQSVISKLGLKTTPVRLADEITAEAPANTVVINVHVTDSNPHRAQRIAGALGKEFISFSDTLESAGSGGKPVKVSVSNPANLPASPVSPRKKVALALGLFLGLVLGLAAAFFRELADNTVKHQDDLAVNGAGSIVGLIPFDKDARRGLVLPKAGSPRAEALRQLRTNIRFLSVDSPPRALVVTSSLPGEGKSSTVINLATVLSETGVKVALLDADLRAPSLARYADLLPTPGLTRVLVGHATISDVTQRMGQTDVIVAGDIPPNPSELLSSQRMADVLSELQAAYDLVLIDAPPLLPVTDAAILAAKTDGALLVVRYGKTKTEHFRRAVEMLETVDAHIFGSVLNMVSTGKTNPDGYGYGYGYGYGLGSLAESPAVD